MTAPGAGERLEHYRGPCRGDGYRRRSAEWHRMRDQAMTRACTFVLTKPAPIGARDKTPRRLACAAAVDEVCRDPETGRQWTTNDRQPAHLVRLRASLPNAEESTT